VLAAALVAAAAAAAAARRLLVVVVAAVVVAVVEFGGGGNGANFQQMQMQRYQGALEITNDTDWSAIQPLVQKVIDARTAVGG